MAAPRKPRTLLISTKNVIETSWPEQINTWYPGKIKYVFITGLIPEDKRLELLQEPCDIFGMNTEMIDWYISHSLRVKSKTYLKNHQVKLNYATDDLVDRFDLIIIDEVSLFKNSQSARFKAIKKWCHKVSNVMLLSATPTPKDIENVWSEIFLIDGGQRLGKTITEFRENYAIAVPLANGLNRYQYSQGATDEVLSLIKDVSTSIPAPDKPLFPEPIVKKVLIKPDPKTEEILQRFKNDFIIKLDNGQNLLAFTKTQLINKIGQIANGSVYSQDVAVYLNSIKFRAIQYKLASITTPVLMTYNYIFDKDLLMTLPGARLLQHPQDFKDWNENKIPIGILSPFSAAHGLNLQDSDCENIFWFGPIWDTEKWIQTNARVCRRGQKRVVTVSVFLLKGSYDEYAFDLCLDKFRLQYNNLIKLQ
jgi:hypothetical protein